MKFCIYSPYIPKHFGGGEFYLLSVAKVLATKGQVSIAVSGENLLSEDDNQRLRNLYGDFLGETLNEKINFIASPLGSSQNFLTKLWWTKQFDVMYYATDGSLFFSLAKLNILHIQVPFSSSMMNLASKIKLGNWQVKNTNSEFTKKIIEQNWRIKINEVHQPVMVDQGHLAKGLNLAKKSKVILHVGRFFKQLHSKRQDILVDIFEKLNDKIGTKDWQLVLLGNVEDQKYLAEIKAKITTQKIKNIEFVTQANRQELLAWYERASLYWHATGFGIDDRKYPEKVEHFGISTVEAMSYGCAPVVINKGGQKEIMSGELKEWLWDEIDECVTKTWQLIEDKKLRCKIQKMAFKRAGEFSQAKFEKKLWKMIEKK